MLVDTYDTAIKKIIKSGINTAGMRLDSGDLYSLSLQGRRMLDGAPGAVTLTQRSWQAETSINM